jgi:ribonuclease D
VDIEHSKEVGYDGKICLIQISTVDTDIVIDPLLIKDQPTLKANLKSVFENPLIKKVFYAGTQDQLWLLRDFDIQVNNSYDIKDVAELLYPSINLP